MSRFAHLQFRRPLALRMRPDLVVQRQTWQGREYWTIKDPLTLKYYRFEDEEFAILAMLDGQASSRGDPRAVRAAIRSAADSAPPSFSSLLAKLHRSHLVIADAAGQGEQLLGRASEQQRRKALLGTLGNLLAIRFRGIDPDRLPDVAQRRVRLAVLAAGGDAARRR